jgi:hypothetical protein
VIRFKVRHGFFLFLVFVSSAILVSGCSMQEISDTMGTCCGASAIPIGALGLIVVDMWREKS